MVKKKIETPVLSLSLKVLPTGCPSIIITGDCLVFPSAFLADGLINGIAVGFALPDGSRFDTNHFVLYQALVQDLGRISGAWLSRVIIDRGGQNAFAYMSVAAATLFIVCLEGLVNTSL